MSWSSEYHRESQPLPSGVDDVESGDALHDDDGWFPLARFAHVAEAGYFADELTHLLEAAVRVRSESSFDGMHHFWATRYVLLAPEPLREKAAIALNELLQASGAADDPPAHPAAIAGPQSRASEATRGELSIGESFDDPRFDLEETGGGVRWVPVMFTLAAGSAVFFGLRWWTDQPRDPGRQPPAGGSADLWDALSRSPAPWTQTLPDGRGQRRLRYDRQRDAVLIEDDLDGDGKPDRIEQFHRGRPRDGGGE